ALNNLGLADRGLESWVSAEERLQRAVEIFEGAYGPGHQWAVSGRRNLTSELILRHRWSEARAVARRLVEVTEGTGNPPSLGDALFNLARVERLAGRPREAWTTLQSAEDLIRRELTSDSSRRLRHQTQTARVLSALGRPEEALRLLAQIDAEQGELPAHHVTRLRTEDAYGAALRRASRLDEAAERFRRVVAIREAHVAQNSRLLADAYSRLGSTLAASGRLDEAAPALGRAISIFESSLGPDYPELSVPLHALGLLEQRLGRIETARGLLERVVELRRRHYPADDRDLLAAEDDLAELVAASE
ncbi:MAG: tetratricopeptide repeat protein, partial [Acidobacteriota bacterium]